MIGDNTQRMKGDFLSRLRSIFLRTFFAGIMGSSSGLISSCTNTYPKKEFIPLEIQIEYPSAIVVDEYSELVKRFNHQYSNDQILNHKIFQWYIDHNEDSPLEKMIEKEYHINLVLPEAYSQEKLLDLSRKLASIKITNPNLLRVIEGKDIFILPNYIRRVYDGIRNSDHIELFEPLNLPIMAHELDHELVYSLSQYFLDGWKRIVAKHGFIYGNDLHSPSIMSDMSTEWSDGTRGPRYVFQRPYAANLKQGEPVEHIATMHEAIYRGEPFITDTKEEENCFIELFKYAHKWGVFSEAERNHAFRLIKYGSDSKSFIQYKVQPGDTLWDIAKNHNISWETIAEDNRAKYPIMMEHPETLQIGTNLRLRQYIQGKQYNDTSCLNPIIRVYD